MKYTKLNLNWNAEPNSPDEILTMEREVVRLEFSLNSFLYENFQERDKGVLEFNNVHKFSLNRMNDEGYFSGKYRYKNSDLPWGEFYVVETDWEIDFPKNNLLILPKGKNKLLKHYIFFLKDSTFECVAENYNFTTIL